jgi:PTS system nitrogen regulatory IIA component
MINIATYFAEERAQAHVPLSSKKRVIQTLSELLIPSKQNKALHQSIFSGLIKREKLGSTAIGNGIAIPHARVEDISTPALAVLTLDNEGIDFDAPDNKPVNLFIGLAVPKEASQLHLELLAQLSHLLKDANLCKSIRESSNSKSLYNSFLMSLVMHENP